MQPNNLTYTGADGDQIYFDDFSRRQWNNCTGGSPSIRIPREPYYRAAHWTFSSGVRIDFDYELRHFWHDVPQSIDGCTTSYAYVLTGVHNNLGRSLTFASEMYNAGVLTTFNDGGSFGVHALPVGYRITSVTDENGRSATFNLSSCPTGAGILCNIFTATDPAGGVTRYEYAADANSPDPTNTLRPRYRLRRLFTPEQVAVGAATPFETIRYDGLFRAERVTDALGAIRHYYPGAIAGDEDWRRGQVVSPVSTSATPVVSTSIFDADNALVQSIDPIGRVTRNEYDNAQRLVRTIYPELNEERRSYDVRSNVIELRRISKSPGSPADIVTSAVYPPSCGIAGQPACATGQTFWSNCISSYTAANCNRPLRETDARGYVQRNTWDGATGLLTRVETGLNSSLNCALPSTDPNYGTCPQTDVVYSLFGPGGNQFRLMTQRTDRISASQSLVTSYSYDTSNHYVPLSATIDPSGLNLITILTFDAIGNLTTINGPRTDVTDVTNVTWDNARRLRMRIEADPDAAGALPRPAVRLNYNAGGLLTSSERGTTTSATGSNFSAVETTTYMLDAVGRRIRATTPAGVTQFSYDAADRPTCTAVRMNPAVYGSLPSNACSLSTQGANGPDRIARLYYDAAGQVTTERRAFGVTTANGFPQTLQQDYARYTYTLNGQRASVRDANNNRSAFVYDGFDRLCRLYFPTGTLGANQANTGGIAESALTCASAGSNPDYEGYSYDPNGNRLTLRLRSGETIGNTFDALNREIVRDRPNPDVDIYSGYDLVGRRLYGRFNSHTNTTGEVTYTYDLAGRVLTETSDGLTFTYQYDAAGNLTHFNVPGIVGGRYWYDALNRVSEVRDRDPIITPGCPPAGCPAVLLVRYEYDSLGRRDRIVRGAVAAGHSGTTTMAYDTASRLQSIGHDLEGTAEDVTITFTYNPAGQVLNRNLSNDNYRWAAPAASRSYVRNGLNQYTSVGGVNSSYDGRGNLLSDGARTHTYDSENHLLSVTGGSGPMTLGYDPLGRLRQLTAGSSTTKFIYSGDRLAAELDGGTVLRRYLHGPGADEPLIWYEGGGTFDNRRWFYTDHQGSVIATTAGPGTATIYAYGSYGEPDSVNEFGGARFRYTGQITLPEARLYHYKARVYDPLLGRFLQTDPVGYESDLNLYAYTYNDPLNLRDTTGEEPEGLAAARNPYMRDSQRSNVPVDRGGVGPRNTTVQAGVSGSFVAGAGGSGGGGRYSYYNERGVETERGSYYTLGARAGVDLGANAGVTVSEGAPQNFTGLDVNVNASLGLVTGSASESVDSLMNTPGENVSGSGGIGPGLRLGASVGGTGTVFTPDRNFTPREPPSFDVPLPGGGTANCVATAQPDGSTTTQCTR